MNNEALILTHGMLDTENGSVQFGDGEAGRRPPTADEQLKAGYRIGLGDLRNPAAGAKQRVDIAVQGPKSKDILLSGPLSASGYALQSRTIFSDENSWTRVQPAPVVEGSQNQVTDPISGPAKFYRLKK